MVLWTDLDPHRLSFPHCLEGLPYVIMLLQICHFKLFLDFPLFFKVDQLTIVKSGFMSVINNIGLFALPGELGGAWLHEIFDDASILFFGDVCRLLDAFRLYRGQIIELIDWSFLTLRDIIFPFLLFSSGFSLVDCFLLQALLNSFHNLRNFTRSYIFRSLLTISGHLTRCRPSQRHRFLELRQESVPSKQMGMTFWAKQFPKIELLQRAKDAFIQCSRQMSEIIHYH